MAQVASEKAGQASKVFHHRSQVAMNISVNEVADFSGSMVHFEWKNEHNWVLSHITPCNGTVILEWHWWQRGGHSVIPLFG
jgi:hypothetical protein